VSDKSLELSIHVTLLCSEQRQFVPQGKYELVVMAADKYAPDLLTSTTDVTIYVTDVNDNAPEFIRPSKSSSRDVICDVTVGVAYTTSADAVVTQVVRQP